MQNQGNSRTQDSSKNSMNSSSAGNSGSTSGNTSSERKSTSSNSKADSYAPEKSGSDNAGAKQTGDKQSTKSETKSIGTVISESLAKETQGRIDQVMGQVTGYFTSVKEYAGENPKEAAALAATIGMAAWALLYTKPGRQLFDKGAGVLAAPISDWISENMSAGKTDSAQQH